MREVGSWQPASEKLFEDFGNNKLKRKSTVCTTSSKP